MENFTVCRLRYASAVESCHTPADNRGSTSPSVSISGVPSLMLLMEGPFMLFTLHSHLVIGLPRLLFPLISPSMTPFSMPRSSLTTCPKYHAYATFDSRVHSGLMFSSTHTLVFLSIHEWPHYHHSPPTPHLKCINFLPLELLSTSSRSPLHTELQ